MPWSEPCPRSPKPPNLDDLLKDEAPNLYSRERATVAAGQNLPLGAVVGHNAATGKLKAFDPAAGDGSEVAAGVLAQAVDATLIDREDAILIARHVIVARGALIWPAGITPAQQGAAIVKSDARVIEVHDSA